MIVYQENEAYCQPCLSPVWDTSLALHALMESGAQGEDPAVASGCRWLSDRQVLNVRGDWASNRRDLRPGGWAFQYRNDYYPDVDDTAAVVMALHRADETAYQEAVSRAEWVLGMQSRSGGWGAFDDNEHYHSTAFHSPIMERFSTRRRRTTRRSMPGHAGAARLRSQTSRGQARTGLSSRPTGSRRLLVRTWGTNYVYGTWSVLCALNAVGEDMQAPYVRKAVDFIVSRQREDGGWGEDCASYWPERRYEAKVSTPSQTSWALLGLMAAGEVDSPAVQRGVDYLLGAEEGDSGARNIITRSASRAYFTCAIMGIAPISRSGRSPLPQSHTQ